MKISALSSRSPSPLLMTSISPKLLATHTQTARSLKLAIPEEFIGKDLSKALMYTGYAAGSTLGSSSTLLAWMLTQVQRFTPWGHPKVQAWLYSVARIRAVFVVYSSGFSRVMDSWGSRAYLTYPRCHHP